MKEKHLNVSKAREKMTLSGWNHVSLPLLLIKDRIPPGSLQCQIHLKKNKQKNAIKQTNNPAKEEIMQQGYFLLLLFFLTSWYFSFRCLSSARCPLCDRCFGQQTNLDRHLKKHESDGPTILDEDRKRYNHRRSIELAEVPATLKLPGGTKANSLLYPTPFYYDLGRTSLKTLKMPVHASPILTSRLELTSPSQSSSPSSDHDVDLKGDDDEGDMVIDDDNKSPTGSDDDEVEKKSDTNDANDDEDEDDCDEHNPIDVEDHSMPSTESSIQHSTEVDAMPAHSLSCKVTICTDDADDTDKASEGGAVDATSPATTSTWFTNQRLKDYSTDHIGAIRVQPFYDDQIWWTQKRWLRNYQWNTFQHSTDK